jgi:copper(I)-binding protein
MSLRHSRWVSTALAATVIATASASLAACGSDDTTSSASSTASSTPSESTAASSPIVAEDPWVKAVDSGMTAAFVHLDNESDSEVVLVSASTPASQMVELHETVMQDGQMVMQSKDGGIPIPANDHAHLEPGGDHIMLMDVTEPIEPGDTVPITLTFDDGSTLEIEAVAKKFSGADEDYDDGDDHDHDH